MRHKRKSPYRHHVVEHKRLGYHVSAYIRGKGKKPIQRHISFHPKTKQDLYSISIQYIDYSSESLDVKAQNYPSALDMGIENRRYYKEPVSITLRGVKD